MLNLGKAPKVVIAGMRKVILPDNLQNSERSARTEMVFHQKVFVPNALISYGTEAIVQSLGIYATPERSSMVPSGRSQASIRGYDVSG